MIKSVNIGGEDRPVSFGLKAIGEISDHNDWGLVSLGHKMKNNYLLAAPAIIFYTLKNGAERNSEPIDFTIHDVYDWVGDAGVYDKSIVDVITCFAESLSSYIEKLNNSKPDDPKSEDVKKK